MKRRISKLGAEELSPACNLQADCKLEGRVGGSPLVASGAVVFGPSVLVKELSPARSIIAWACHADLVSSQLDFSCKILHYQMITCCVGRTLITIWSWFDDNNDEDGATIITSHLEHLSMESQINSMTNQIVKTQVTWPVNLNTPLAGLDMCPVGQSWSFFTIILFSLWASD